MRFVEISGGALSIPESLTCRDLVDQTTERISFFFGLRQDSLNLLAIHELDLTPGCESKKQGDDMTGNLLC